MIWAHNIAIRCKDFHNVTLIFSNKKPDEEWLDNDSSDYSMNM